MKKLLCVLICMVVSLIMLSACAGSKISGDPSTTASLPTEQSTASETTMPEETIPEAVKLSIGIPQSHSRELYENEYTKWLTEQSGIELTFVPYAYGASNYLRQLDSELKVGAKIPDILFGFEMNPDSVAKYAEENVILDLSAYLNDEKKSEIFWSRVDALRGSTDVYTQLLVEKLDQMMYTTNASGEKVAYGLPSVYYSTAASIPYMPFINTKWLDAVKKPIPTTLEELRDVLIAFKFNDPNGNNTQDELPMTGCEPGTPSGDAISWFLNYYLYCDSESLCNVDENGKLYIPQTTDAYREGLEYIRDLIERGLLSIRVATAGAAEINNLLRNGVGIGVVFGNPEQIFRDIEKANEYVPLDLFGNAYYKTNSVNMSSFITRDCADVDAAWELLMLMYTEEAAIRQRYGSPNEEWKYSDGTVMTEFGQTAVIKVFKDTFALNTTDSWKCKYGSFFTFEITEAVDLHLPTQSVQTARKLIAQQRTNFAAAYAKTQNSNAAAVRCPYLEFNAQEESALGDNIQKLKTTIKKWQQDIMCGTYDISNEAVWRAYLDELELAGSKTYLDTAQQCYDRMYPNGHITG